MLQGEQLAVTERWRSGSFDFWIARRPRVRKERSGPRTLGMRRWCLTFLFWFLFIFYFIYLFIYLLSRWLILTMLIVIVRTPQNWSCSLPWEPYHYEPWALLLKMHLASKGVSVSLGLLSHEFKPFSSSIESQWGRSFIYASFSLKASPRFLNRKVFFSPKMISNSPATNIFLSRNMNSTDSDIYSFCRAEYGQR